MDAVTCLNIKMISLCLLNPLIRNRTLRNISILTREAPDYSN